MANLAQIQSIAQGQFFVKDSLGNLTELKVGDTVSLNDTIVAASSNTDLSKIEILFDTNELITLSQGEQLLDTTLLASTFGNEELAFDKQEVDETLNAWNNAQDGDETDMETAAGDVTEQATNAGDERAADGGALRSKFNSRDGDATDIVSDLREASWTGGIERIIEDSENMLLEDPLPVVYTIIEGIDVVNEGDSANYVVKLQDAAGNPVIATQDTIIYVRYTNKTTQDGDTQYNNENIIEVVIKAGTSQTEFTINTNDDYLADNGEIYNVSITGNNSTEFDMRTGDVAGNKTNVDTTILDNSKDTPNDPYDQTTTSPVEGDLDTITIKLFALTEDGNRVPANEVAEGSPASYVAVAFDKNGVELTLNETVEVTFGKTGDSATAGGVDYNSTTQTVTLGKSFSTNTVDDYLADNGEKYSVQITDKTLSNASKYETVVIDTTSVTTTILDNSKDTPNDPYDQTTTPPVEGDLDTITIKLFALDKDGNRVPANEVAEGSPASYVAVAFDKNGVELTLNETVEVTFGKTGDSATAGGVDYNSTTQTVTLGKSFSTNTVDDYLADNGEKYSVQITDKTLSNASKYETVVIDTTSVTTTILDNSKDTPNDPYDQTTTPPVEGDLDTITIKLFALDKDGNRVPANEVAEGSPASYVAVAFDKNGVELTLNETVEVTFGKTGDSATAGGVDYNSTTQTVTLGKPFSTNTVDDYLADNGEKYSVQITDKTLSNASKYETVVIDTTSVTTTILDNSKDTPNDPYDQTTTPPVEGDLDTITIKLFALDKDGNRVPANEVAEGSPASYVAVAFDKNGVELTLNETVEVTFGKTGDSATAGGVDYNSTTQTVTLGKSFSTNTVDDYLADNGEKYSVQITDKTLSNASKYETVVIDTTSVTTTILDNSKDTPNDPYDQTTTPPVEGDLDTITIKLFALDKDGNRVPANEVAEGSPASYVAVAFDKNGVELTLNETVEVTFGKTGDSATAGGVDYNSTTQTVTLGKSFSTNTVDDYLADNGEKYSVQITDKTLSNASKYETVVIDTTSVTTTILDNSKDTPNDPYDQTTTPPVEGDLDTITIKLFALDKDGNRVPANEVAEGSPASYVAVAFDKNGVELTLNETVEVTFGKTGDSATAGGVDYNSTTQTVTLGKPFSTNTVDDYLADNGEKYSVQITDKTLSNASKYETVVIDTTSVTTTILDNSKDTPNDPYDQTTTPPVEGDLDTITIKLFALDKDGNRVPANEVAEGSPASYVAVAFDKNGVELTLNETVEVTFGKTGDSATAGGVDYNSTTQTVTLGKPFSTNTVDDYLADNGEKYSVQITDKTLSNASKYETVVIDTTSVTTTILDNSKDTPNDPYDQTTTSPVEGDLDTITIKLFALTEDGKRVPANEVAEGSPASYVAVAFDKNGVELTLNETVEVTFGKTGDSATAGGVDYNSTTQTVTLGKSFSTNTVDDYLADNGEKYSVQITDKTLSNASKYETVVIDTTSVTTTIKDNPSKVEQPDTGTGNDDPINGSYGKEDTVYVKIEGKPTVVEGGKLSHTVTLVDKNGNPVTIPAEESVTVTLTYTIKQDGGSSDDYVTKEETIIIKGGTSSTTFENITKVDFVTEGEEVYEITISKVEQSGAFENVVIDSTANKVTDTILDGITLGTPVDSKVDEDNFYQNDLNGTDDGDLTKSNLTASESLGITIPAGYEDIVGEYKINFNGEPKVMVDGQDYELKSNGVKVVYEVNGDKIVGKAGSKTVFDIVLNKTTGKYEYKQYENIDHPKFGEVSSEEGLKNNNTLDDIVLNFQFNITTTSKNGQTVTSPSQDFKVTVNDSTPLANNQDLIVYEDSTLQFVLSDGAFKDGKIKIDNNDGNGFKEYSTNDTVKIYEGSKEVGTIQILEEGKLEFKPVEDYSKYDTSDKNKLPNFKYQVSDTDGDYAQGQINIQVKPVADAPTLTVKNIETTEDYNNTQEGTNKVALELIVPSLSKDQTDKNNATGDSPERNGEITLTFTNGSAVTGAKIFKSDGTTQVGSDITTAIQPLKVIIVNDTKTDVDYTYHHKGITIVDISNPPAGTVYLTKSEYESLKIQHAEDNDTDIKITIKVTSYEVDDSGKPLFGHDTYTDKNNANLKSETTANMIVKIQAVTDDITLNWDSTKVNANIGTLDNNVLKFNTIKENNQDPKAGNIETNELNFGSLLTPTSGAGTDTKLDLDGSEKRSYTIKLEAEAGTILPDYIYITIGNQKDIKVHKDANGNYKLDFSDTNNKLVNPEFKIKFPDYWSGDVTGTITLRTKDYGVDNDADTTDYTTFGGEADGVKKAEVKFEAKVTSIANIATIQVKQAIGYEDAGRGGDEKNQPKTGDILENGKNGIPLDIKVTSTDKDNSETFTIKISNIPNGGAIHYNGQLLTPETGKDYIEIPQFNNNLELKFIPPHNSHGDFDLTVNVKTIDGNDTRDYTDNPQTTIKVVVKDVADSVVGNDYNEFDLVATDADDNVIGNHKQYNAISNEDEPIGLSLIFTDANLLASYDSASEDLTIIIRDLPIGVTLTGNVTLINGQYIFKASDIPNIKIATPPNYSGELNFNIDYITTEAGKEANNPSKTFDSEKSTNNVSIFVKPTVDAGFKSNTTKAEDIQAEKVDGETNSYYKLDLGISHQNGDTDETLGSVKLDKPDDGEFKLFIKNSDGSFTAITDFNKTYTAEEIKNIYVQAPENKHGNFDITVNYTVKDSHYGTTESNYVATKTGTIIHTLTINPVTDEPKLEIKSIDDLSNSEVTETKILIKAEDASFTLNTKTTSEDIDNSEKVVKIIISGVPKGVTISGITDTLTKDKDGVTLYEHNGVYVIEVNKNITSLDGILGNIQFDITSGADFIDRDITITTYTEDSGNGDIKQDSKTINIAKDYGTGSTDPIVLEAKTYNATEDTKFTLKDIFNVSGGQQTGEIKIKIENGTLEGYEKDANGYYIINLKGNAADVGTILSQIKVIPDLNFNDNKGKMEITVDGFGLNNSKVEVPVKPVTDPSEAVITPVDGTEISENGEFKFNINLKNDVDVGTTLEDNVIYIKANETYKDSSETATGKLYYIDNSGQKVYLPTDGKFELKDGYTIDNLPNFGFEAGENRNGDVSITVSTENKEANADNYESATGTTTITVIPVVSSEIKVGNVQDGIEDEKMASIELNVVKADPSEKFESVLIKVASGVAVYYDNGTKLAMNLGDGSWLVPVSGDGKTLPEIFFKGKEHLAGNIDFEAIINVKDGEAKVTKELTGWSVTITEVADGVTIDPAKTGIDKNAFEWTSLNLNAKMKDIDGSEKMHFTLKDLDSSAQFRVNNGDGTYTDLSSQAKFENGKWTINGIEAKDINSIEISHDKSVSGVKVEAWTVDGNVPTLSSVSGTFDLSYKADAKFDNGTFTLAKDMDIDFNNIGKLGFTNVEKIDLGVEGKNELLNLTLQDVLGMGKKDGSGNINLDILGGTDDKVSFAKDNGWELKTENKGKVEGDKTFDVYTNSGDSTVQVKVEQPISDGITN